MAATCACGKMGFGWSTAWFLGLLFSLLHFHKHESGDITVQIQWCANMAMSNPSRQ